MKLYHVTREHVVRNIWERGVHPEYSTGKMLVTWWVDEPEVMWALAHVSARWQLPVDRLVVIEADIPEQDITRWSRVGIYYTRKPVKRGIKIWGYEKFLKPEV